MMSRLLSMTMLFWGVTLCGNAAPLGLVLSGGGAKGAYEVGAWTALYEAGLTDDVVAISGASIGAVNAALFASWPDPKGAERLWLENLGKVFVPNKKILQFASEKKFTEFSDAKLREYADIAGIPVAKLPADSRKVIIHEAENEFRRNSTLRDISAPLKSYMDTLSGKVSDGLCDGSALRQALENSLPKDWPGTTPRVYATALTHNEWRCCTFYLNEGTPEDRILRLLASTAIPVVFSPVKIGSRAYVDGGWEANGGDNVPIAPILANHPEIKTIVVVYLSNTKHSSGNQINRVRKAAEQKDVRLIEVVPSKDIDGMFGIGMFDTSPDTARRLIELGRKDARNALVAARLVKSTSYSGQDMK